MEVDNKIKQSNGNPEYKVTQPIRISYRDRAKHPIRFVNVPRKSTNDLNEYVRSRKVAV